MVVLEEGEVWEGGKGFQRGCELAGVGGCLEKDFAEGGVGEKGNEDLREKGEEDM